MTEILTPYSSVTLQLSDAGLGEDPREIRLDLSAAAYAGGLWLGSDEGAAVELLLPQAGGTRYAEHRRLPLAAYVALPGASDEEVDIEGLASDGGYLWVLGSHGLRRKRPKRFENSPEEAIERLHEVDADSLPRQLLARIPIHREGAERTTLSPCLDVEGHSLRAGSLKVGSKGNVLVKDIKKDRLLKRFLEIPCKENGFDIEGIAVRGDRVYLGLRGPVLRGWAILLELRVEAKKDGRLTLLPMAADGSRYRRHFLDLNGLGIRDLLADGEDLLILAGPTMDHPGPCHVYRWPGGWCARQADIVTAAQLVDLGALPAKAGCDKPEGMTFVPSDGGPPQLLVVYDSPCPERLSGRGSVTADLFRV